MRSAFAFACLFALCAPAAAQAGMPSLALRTGDGRSLDLDQFKGRPVLVDFWASWCAPCLPGLKSLETIQRDYPGAAIVPVSLDRGGPMAAIRGYAKANITRLPLYLASPEEATHRFAIAALPTTILFDASGREHARFGGTVKEREKAIRRAFAALLTRTSRRGNTR